MSLPHLFETNPVLAFRFFIILGDSGSALKTGLSMLASLASEILFDGGFSQCTGLQMEQELVPYAEGGLVDYVHKLPGRTNYGNITLNWGMGYNNSLWEWQYNNARAMAAGTDLKRKDGTLICLPYGGMDDPLSLVAGSQVWYFKRGLPVKWTGPEFDASSSAVAIERIEIAHEGLERWFPPNMSAIVGAVAGKLGIGM
ncbi:MAG TPA: phage tail protein [Symbiobacteriaceae bacterium]|jgi:phage tail-like protein|nr:phage tail protein [Symbiobacteriaceae bacterium]